MTRIAAVMTLIALLFNLFELTRAVFIPIHIGKRCMILTASFDPINIEARLPKIEHASSEDHFQVSILDSHYNLIRSQQFPLGYLYRRVVTVQVNTYNEICFELITINPLKGQLYFEFKAEDDFKIGSTEVQIPAELGKDTHIRAIYSASKVIGKYAEKIIEHQKRERELEDQITNVSLARNHKIVNLTVLECVVIFLSSLYQIMTLRKYLIDKSMF